MLRQMKPHKVKEKGQTKADSIFQPKSVQTKCSRCTVHIPILNDGNFVHRVIHP